MTRLLPRLLNVDDLPSAELHAARIDGEVYAIGDWYTPIDEPETSELRAAALAHLVPSRMIVERSSALWVHGARSYPPFRHQLCSDIASRTTPHLSSRFEFRECRLDPVDILQLGSVRVTSHLRTAIDLLRTCEPFSASDALDVLAILRLGGSTVSECRHRIRVQPRYPGVRRAIERTTSVERWESALPGWPAAR